MNIKAIFLLAGLTGIFLANTVEGAYTPDPWERQIVAACLILEASDQGERGMTAVANVIANRADKNARKYLKQVKRPYAFSSLNRATTGKTGSRGYADHVRRGAPGRRRHRELLVLLGERHAHPDDL